MKLIKILFIILFLGNINLIGQQIQWPFLDGTRGTVTGTVGEWRNAAHRYHGGVDLTGPNYNVYTCDAGGLVTFDYDPTDAWDSWVQVGNIVYKHVAPVSTYVHNVTNIGGNIQVGDMFNANNCPYHVHLDEETGTTSTGQTINYLYQRLAPVTDNIAPRLWDFVNNNWSTNGANNINVVRYYSNGYDYNSTTTQYTTTSTIDNVNHKIIYGKTDMVVRARDGRIDTNGNDPTPVTANNTNNGNTRHNAPNSFSSF